MRPVAFHAVLPGSGDGRAVSHSAKQGWYATRLGVVALCHTPGGAAARPAPPPPGTSTLSPPPSR